VEHRAPFNVSFAFRLQPVREFLALLAIVTQLVQFQICKGHIFTWILKAHEIRLCSHTQLGGQLQNFEELGFRHAFTLPKPLTLGYWDLNFFVQVARYTILLRIFDGNLRGRARASGFLVNFVVTFAEYSSSSATKSDIWY
jgi:hypothetical protein